MAEVGKLTIQYSASQVDNSRYDIGKDPSPMHSIEDKFFMLSMPHSKVFCVLDGHDGANAVEFVYTELKRIFSSKSWETIARGRRREHIVHALKEFFTEVDRMYFDGMRESIDRRKRIQDTLQVSCRAQVWSFCKVLFVCLHSIATVPACTRLTKTYYTEDDPTLANIEPLTIGLLKFSQRPKSRLRARVIVDLFPGESVLE